MNRRSLLLLAILLGGCDEHATPAPAATAAPKQAVAVAEPAPAREAPHPNMDPTNIVSIAAGSKDHTTLVAALKAADYVDSVANAGPFTVFAPTNAAFEKLPPGTVDGLLKPEKQGDLKEVLKYHVAVSTYRVRDLHDGQTLSMANGGKATIHVRDGKTTINNANIVASIPASNGIVHVIDAVLLPPAK